MQEIRSSNRRLNVYVYYSWKILERTTIKVKNIPWKWRFQFFLCILSKTLSYSVFINIVRCNVRQCSLFFKSFFQFDSTVFPVFTVDTYMVFTRKYQSSTLIKQPIDKSIFMILSKIYAAVFLRKKLSNELQFLA